MKIDTTGKEYKIFSAHFEKLYNGREPLFALIDSIERMMSVNSINYFKLPGFKSMDLRNHYFIFKRVDDKLVFSYLK